MTTQIKFLYEVGFSFLKQDEAVAYDLNDRIQDRVSTFIYSKRQEELGGTDGEKKFNKVFYEECRVVVVLYRDGWGETPWTRIEETAIKNRAFDKGWEFLLFVNLDINSNLPTWIPKSYIWLDYQRFKAEGAIAVIEQKVKEAGGIARQETIADAAERLKRLRNAEKERATFLRSPDAIREAKDELNTIITKLKDIKPIIEDPATSLHLGTSERQYPPMYEFGYRDYYLCFNNSKPFESDIQNGVLKVSIYEKSGHHNFDYVEQVHKEALYRFDRDLVGNNGWSDHITGKGFLVTNDLINNWAKQFISDIGKRNKEHN
jgi:hypothetical protein